MKSLIELREQQAKHSADARAALDQIDNNVEEARAAELETEFDQHMADFDAVGENIARAEKLEAAEKRMAEGDSRRPIGTEGEAREDAPLEYKEVFTRAVRVGVAGLTPEERDVLAAYRAELPEELRAQTSTTDASGGYTVPTEFSGEIDKAMAAWGPMWDATIARELVTTNGREIEWPTVDDTAKTGRIKAQNADADDDGTDDVVFGQKLLNAYIYDTGIVRIPIELLQDSFFNMESLLTDLFGERLGRLANTTLTTGTGSSQPNGVVTASALGKTAAAVAAVTADEIIDLQHSVDPAYRASPNCRFMFNDSTLATIRKLKDGDGNYLWQMGDVRVGEPSQILGNPYSVNQAMDSLAAAKKVALFGDFSKYVVRKVGGFSVMTLRERYAEAFQVGMIGFKRFDGELLNTAAVKHLITAAS